MAPPKKPRFYASIPYVPGVSERIQRVFRKYDVNIAHKPTRKLRNELCHLKDKRPTHDKPGVVYKLNCLDCDAKYIGETGRQVSDRMTEHKRDIRVKRTTSKVFQHIKNTRHTHTFDFENVSVLEKCTNEKVRLHLESIHTYSRCNTLNRSKTLNSAYKPLFATQD